MVLLLLLLLLLGVLNELRNLGKSSIIAIVRSCTIDICQILSQLEALTRFLVLSSPSLSTDHHVVVAQFGIIGVESLIVQNVTHLRKTLVWIHVVTQVRHIEVNRCLRIVLEQISTSQVSKHRSSSSSPIQLFLIVYHICILKI